MKFLPILWQRLVDETGQTCERCGKTYEEIQKALEILKKSFFPLAIEVTFEEREIDQKAFINDPFQSNQVWISGKPLEEWLGAHVGQSPCCDICGDAECRTIEIDAKVYESIPADLIIKASLIAASQLYGDFPSKKYSRNGKVVHSKINSCCCSDSTSNDCCSAGNNMTEPLKFESDLFKSILVSIEKKAHSLHEIRRFKDAGIEGWFKVEVVAALAERIQKVQNEGPDLLLSDGTQIELKAGCGLSASYIREGAQKHGTLCLFLGYCDSSSLELLNTPEVELIESHEVSDGYDDWVIGMIRPRARSLA